MSDSSATDRVFGALAHPVRRRIIDLLVEAPGVGVGAVASHFDISRVAVMKHIATLEAAELVLSHKAGRTRHLYFNPIPIQQIHDRWITRFSGFWSERVSDTRSRVEARSDARRRRHA